MGGQGCIYANRCAFLLAPVPLNWMRHQVFAKHASFIIAFILGLISNNPRACSALLSYLLHVQGPVGRFCEELPDRMDNVKFEVLQNTGHCAQDDNPAEVHAHLLPWLRAIERKEL
jgi:pimeloyl-ACP methyl ester carboxylesterase